MCISPRNIPASLLLALAGLLVLTGCGDEAGTAGTDSSAVPSASSSSDATASGDVEPSSPASTQPLPSPSSGTEPVSEPEPTPVPPSESAPSEPPADSGTSLPPGADPAPSGEGRIVLQSVTPDVGPEAGGTAIVVRGRGFRPDDDLFIDGRLAEAIDVVDDRTIFAETPPGVAGTVSVRVAGSEASAVLADGFRYIAPVSVSEITPARGPQDGGTPITLRGVSFTPRTVVTIGGRGAIDVRYVDSSTLTMMAPPGSVGPADVRVSGENGTVLLAGAFTYTAVPRLDAVEPAAGPAAGGIDVELNGRGLAGTTEVRFGAAEATVLEVEDHRVRVRVPPGAPGVVDVRLRSSDGDARLGGAFAYVPAGDSLAVTAVLPGQGSVAGGDAVTVAGRFPEPVTAVFFDGEPAAVVATGPWAVEVATPALPRTGLVDVTVEDAEDAATLEDGFLVLTALELDGIEPAQADVAGGVEVRLDGAGFEAPLEVRIGGLRAEVLSHTSTTIQARVPPGSAGLADVVVRSQDREVRLAEGFRYTEDPEIFGMIPPRGAIAGNTLVQVYGRGLAGVEAVRVGGVEAPTFEERDPALLLFRTPPGPPGAAPVTVDVNGAAVDAPVSFFYFNPFAAGGGWWGERIRGAVNVTVLDGETGQPISDAFVTLSIRATETQFTARTNTVGQATVSGEGVRGGQSVHIVAENYSAVTIQDVNAENIVVFLTYICTDPEDPRCDGDGDPPPLPFGTVQGELVGIDKIADPGPGRFVMGVVYPTFPLPWNRLEDPLGGARPDPAAANAVLGDGPYRLNTAVGTQAIVAFCGVWDSASATFEPRFMAVARGVFVADGATVTVDLDCDIGLSRSLTTKLVDSPAATDPRYTNRVVPYLDFGGEGVFGGLWIGEGRGEEFTFNRLPRLEGPLADVTLTVAGSTFEGAGLPITFTVERQVRSMDRLLTLPPLVASATLVRPSPLQGGRLEGRRIEWRPNGTTLPDYYYLFAMDDMQDNVLWEMWVPGDQTSLDLPQWPPEAPGSPLQPGDFFVLILFAVDAFSFDYDSFQYQDLSFLNMRSWSINGWFLQYQ